MRNRRERGQAAVETALTLPLAVFMILGTLQLFMMLQGRILAQYAISRAVRQGSLHHGDCRVMQETAVAALIPSFHPFAKPGKDWAKLYAGLFDRLKKNKYRYVPSDTPGQSREVAWLYRDEPGPGTIPNNIEEVWNLPQPDGQPFNLKVRMVFWYPLRIPFANWVIASSVAAHQGIQAFQGYNVFSPSQKANWVKDGAFTPASDVRSEFAARLQSNEYVVPITTSAVLGMMTPPRQLYFKGQCPLSW